MPGRRPTTIDEYIEAAPKAGQPHLRKLRSILKKAAPKAQEAIKWNMPFFIEPRFLFAFSAHKAHLSFAPMAGVIQAFEKELQKHQTTKNFLKIPYDEPILEAFVLKMAKYCVKNVSKRSDDAFW